MNRLFSDARKNKDKTFDGTFFFAVTTTGIFCRPSCPAPVAKEENVRYFSTMFEAMEQGYRPCLRCRPDITTYYDNPNPSGADLVQSALNLIYEGFLADHSIQEMAKHLDISERHLRTLFIENLGASPGKINRYHKALFAKRLVLNSNHPITDIAYGSGFGSLRRFHEVFKSMFGTSPTELRQVATYQGGKAAPATLQLHYLLPMDFGSFLSFLRPRAVKGVETVTGDSYSRTFRTGQSKGYFTVTDNPKKSCLELQIECDDPRCYMAVYSKVRRMFDLDTDIASISDRFYSDPILRDGMIDGYIPRMPVAFDPFEFVIRAILGQQVSVKAATTLAGRVAAHGLKADQSGFPYGLNRFFPTPEEFLRLDLTSMGITQTRQATLKRAAEAVIDETIQLTRYQGFNIFRRAFSGIKGIGDWTVNYVAMRGLGMTDAFPYSDLGVIKSLSANNRTPGRKEILAIAERWRPYRAYATLCLWNKKTEVST